MKTGARPQKRAPVLRWWFAAALAGCFSLVGCSQPEPLELHTVSQPHMGTVFTIRVFGENPEAAIASAFARIEEIEQAASDYREDSELNQLAHAPANQPVPLSDDLFALLDKSLALAQTTDGAFDPTLGPLIHQWRRARKTLRLPSPGQIAAIKKDVGFGLIQLDRDARTATLLRSPLKLDLGGIAKGYAADAALAALSEAGFPQALVAGSGDIRLGAPPPGKGGWRVGVRSLDVDHVGEVTELTDTVLLKNAAISTSGDTQQFLEIDGKRYSHIVDPDTGLGKIERIAVTIIAADTTTTDSYATAVSVLGAERGLDFIERQLGVECLILTESESLKSSNFP